MGKKLAQRDFKLTRIAAAVSLALTVSQVHAGAGWGNSTNITGAPIKVPTYYANSPSGLQANGLDGLPSDSGTALRKFVDTLPSIPGLAPSTTAGVGVGNQIPQAVPEKWVNGNGVTTSDDYYEIAVVEYSQRMHSDLAKPTRLRGYVQLSTAANPGKRIPLNYPDGTPILDSQGAQVFAHDEPHYLGPVIIANKGTAVRLKYTNYLPFGIAKGAELFIPVDPTLPGAGFGPDGVNKFTQNRVDLHLEGGDSPWISDGTPHQWIAPAGEAAAYALIDPNTGKNMGKGSSAQNVPDMPDPGPGSNTLYFPNNQSGRLMFYHDQTSGLTRLNVYAGMTAGYLIQDPVEQGLVTSGIIPAEQIPLVIQDKSFVPKDIAVQDAKWDTVHWGQEGDLWFPHVYETQQDPNAFDGTNPVGRWDWGPWFWPVFPAAKSLPTGNYGDASTTPEANMDTPVVNGTAYPTVTVQPKAYRFRILNASNDRHLNLGLYVADPTIPKFDPLTQKPNPGFEKEVKMVPAAPNTGLPPTWPADGRAGGAPDPTLAGPDIIQIGNEGGFIPHVSVIKSQPVTYEYNRRTITVLQVLDHGLFLAPSERADAVIDFSQYAGKTLIVYNDAPAPDPFFDARYDYYTGDQDLTGTGGAHSTKPGYGPNTRTIMQIKVAPLPFNAPVPAPFNVAALETALPAAYGQSQERPVIPEVAYNDAFGTRDVNNYANIYTGSVYMPTLNWTPTAPGQAIKNVTLTNGGTSYTSVPQVVFVGGVDLSPAGIAAGNAAATAVATVDAKQRISGIQLINGGSGYTSAPLIKFAGGGGMGATAVAMTALTHSLPVYNKALHELFEPFYGRMNFILAVELPFTNNVIQTTVPLAYIDPVTETIADGETQIWKITHNGVSTHAVNFHKLDVQLINRIGWDGQVKPPEDNELGWKDTVKMRILEDTVVAVRAKRPQVPFGQPQSVRAMDPSRPLGVVLGFSQTYLTGNPTAQFGQPGYNPNWGRAAPAGTVSNAIVNFDNEYVWHNQNLGYEANDFIRPIVFNSNDVIPDAPTSVTIATGGLLTWTDPTSTVAPAVDAAGVPTLGNPKNEIGFKILRSDNGGAFAQVGTALANATSWTDPAWTAASAYQVVAYNAAGNSQPGMTDIMMASVAPGTLTFPAQPAGTPSPAQTVTLRNTGSLPLAIGNITIGGADPLSYSQTNTCGASLAPAGSCAINVVFTPDVDGAKSAILNVTDSAGVQTVTLNGIGGVASATLTPSTPISFPNQQVGSASVAQAVTLANTGSVPLDITSILTGGTNYLDFVQTNTCGASLAVGANCTINVAFQPTTTGARVGTLAVVDTAGTHTVSLGGTGIATPSATLNPSTTLAFGSYPVAATATAPQPVILTNTGAGPLSITSIGIDIWGHYTNFGQYNNCGASLDAGTSCTINVTFTPNLLGTKTARLSVKSAAGTQTLTLTGTAAQPVISLTPATLAFGTQPLNTASAAQTATLTNTGVIPVNISSIGIEVWGNYQSFAQTNTCNTSLAVGASCTISMTFKPTALGAKSGRLKVVDGVGTQYINLSGTGQ